MAESDSPSGTLLVLAEAPVAAVVQAGVSTWSAQPLAIVSTLLEAKRLLERATYEVVLADTRLPGLERGDVARLGQLSSVVLLLDETGPETPAEGLPWVPREIALVHPSVLQASLSQARSLAQQRRQIDRLEVRLGESQQQVDQIFRMLGGGASSRSPRWHNQRVMLERLAEEVARVERHGGDLSVILAELATAADTTTLTWIASQLTPHKRYCDVIGQYGPHGFMLLLPQTGASGAQECCQRLTGLLQVASGENAASQTWRIDYGVASYLQPHTTPVRLLREAEEHLARARSPGEEGKG